MPVALWQISPQTMSNINDKATVSLFVNGEQAESAMERLRNKAADLDKQLQAAMAAGDKKSANKLQREIDRVSKKLNKTESRLKVRASFWIISPILHSTACEAPSSILNAS